MLALLSLIPVAASAGAPTEEQVKAAFLINFAKYIDWPSEGFPSPDSPYVFVVLGDARIDSALREMAAGKQVAGRSLLVAAADDGSSLAGGVHVLFVAEGAEGKLAPILALLDASCVLTVGESDQFLKDGGVVNLARRDHKIRLQINLGAAQSKQFKISSKLLSVSDVVKGRKE